MTPRTTGDGWGGARRLHTCFGEAGPPHLAFLGWQHTAKGLHRDTYGAPLSPPLRDVFPHPLRQVPSFSVSCTPGGAFLHPRGCWMEAWEGTTSGKDADLIPLPAQTAVPAPVPPSPSPCCCPVEGCHPQGVWGPLSPGPRPPAQTSPPARPAGRGPGSGKQSQSTLKSTQPARP